MRSLRIVAGILLASASCLPAYAQNYAQPINWAGFYVGLGAGYAWGRAVPTTAGTPTLTTKGFDGDISGGYNFQFGNFVFGPELSFALGDVKGQVPDGGSITYYARARSLATFTAVFGYAFDRFLPYVKVGAAYGELQTAFGCSANAPVVSVCHVTGAFISSADAAKWGLGFGGGFKYALDQNWAIGVEYMHYDFGTISVLYTGIPVVGSAQGQSKVTFDTVLATLSYRF